MTARAIALQGIGYTALLVGVQGFGQNQNATQNTGGNQRRPQIQWLPAHTPWVAPVPRRRPRKKRDAELFFLGQ